ncbi:ankyrin repeat domain-containing protein [Brachyspira pulli]|uniref:ankyrin repeat domain-containing protein n=1 Tax=Brachyspira pulli TaxID=310721 RepID=UPI0030074E30
MKRYILFILLLLSSLLFSQEKIKVAVLPFSSVNEEEGDTISSIFANELSKRKVYTVLTRNSRMEKVMKELNFQRNGLTDENTIAEIGKALNAQYVMTGEIAKLGRSSVLVVSMINVETLENITGDTKTFKNIEDVLQYVPQMVNEITGTRGVTIYDTDILGDTTKRIEPTSGAKDALEKVIRKREGEKHVDKIESLVIRGVNTYTTGGSIEKGTWVPEDFKGGYYTYGNTYNDMFGVTPLMIAAAMKYNDILGALIAAGADIDLEEKHTKYSEYNGRKMVGHTALSYAILSGNLEGALMLINAGADVHKKDFYLYNAVGLDDVKMARLLIEKGCDVNEIPSFSDTTILETAVKRANVDMVKLLLLNKINIHNRKDELLYKAISKYSIYETDEHKSNNKNVITIIRLLLDAGIDIDTRTSVLGTTPLIEACKEGYTDIVKLLIEYGADVNYSDKYGKKPLKVAKKNDIVRLLIDAGATE